MDYFRGKTSSIEADVVNPTFNIRVFPACIKMQGRVMGASLYVMIRMFIDKPEVLVINPPDL